MNEKAIIYDPNTQTFSWNGENVSMLEINNIVQKYLTQPDHPTETSVNKLDEIYESCSEEIIQGCRFYLRGFEDRGNYQPTESGELPKVWYDFLLDKGITAKKIAAYLTGSNKQIQSLTQQLKEAEKDLATMNVKAGKYMLENERLKEELDGRGREFNQTINQ